MITDTNPISDTSPITANVIPLLTVDDWSTIKPINPCTHNLDATNNPDPNCYSVNGRWLDGGQLNIIASIRTRNKEFNKIFARFYDYGYVTMRNVASGDAMHTLKYNPSLRESYDSMLKGMAYVD